MWSRVAFRQPRPNFGCEGWSCNEGTKPTHVSFGQLETWQVVPMPYFNFDLVIGEDFKNQGGMILEDTEIAIDKADSLASELCVVRPELRSRGYSVRVTSFYRANRPTGLIVTGIGGPLLVIGLIGVIRS